jgi:hypothetical protein
MSAPRLSLSSQAATGAGTAFPFGNAQGVQAHIYSAAGSSCSVVIEGGMTENGPWIPLITTTDPSATGIAFSGVAFPWMRLNVSARVSGTLSGYLRSLDWNPGPWNNAILPTVTATAVSCTSLTDSGLTATRIPFAGTGGLLEDEAAFTYTKGTNTAAIENVVSTTLKGNAIRTPTVISGDGAITVAPGTIVLTKGSAAAITLAAPTATDHDGYVINVVSTTAYAHVITFASGKINGGSNVTITFGNVAGSGVTLIAYQGVWYTLANWGTTTIGT